MVKFASVWERRLLLLLVLLDDAERKDENGLAIDEWEAEERPGGSGGGRGLLGDEVEEVEEVFD